MKSRQSGFTLVELIVVIVILGIMAAVAIPRYANNIQQAHVAVLNGTAGAVRSAAMQVQGLYQATYASAGGTPVTSVTMRDGTTVATSQGSAGSDGGIPLPSAAGIGNAVAIKSAATSATPDIQYDAANQRFYLTAVGNIATCSVQYNTLNAAGAADAATPVRYQVVFGAGQSSGC